MWEPYLLHQFILEGQPTGNKEISYSIFMDDIINLCVLVVTVLCDFYVIKVPLYRKNMQT